MINRYRLTPILLVMLLFAPFVRPTAANPAVAPAVIATTPNHNSIERNDAVTPLTATFDGALDPATLAANVTLWSAGVDGVVPSGDDVPVAVGVAYDDPTRTVTVTPDAPLANDLYIVRYGSGITAVDGTPLAAAVDVAFRVRTPVTWTGNVNQFWGTGGNWSTGNVPGAHDYVIVDLAPNSPTVNLNSTTQTAGTLEIANPNATVSHNSGSFTVTDEVINHGRFQIGGPTGNTTLTNGNFHNFGTLRSYPVANNSARLSVATVFNDGQLLVEDVFTFNRANTTLINRGSIDIAAAGRLELSASAPTFRQTAGSTTIAAGGRLRNATNGTLTLDLLGGSFSGASDFPSYGVALTIDPAMTFSNATLAVRTASSLSGNIPAGLTLWVQSNGDLVTNGSWTNNGVLQLGPAAYGGTPYSRVYINNNGTLTNNGTIRDTVEGGSGDSDRATFFGNVVNNGLIEANLWFKFRGVGATLTNNGTITLLGNDREFIIENGLFVNNGIVEGDGRLRFTGTTSNTLGGTLRPGRANRAAILTVRGGLTQSAAALTTIEIGGATVDSGYDQLNVTDANVTLNGTLAVSVINNYDPPVGQTFTIVTTNRTRLGEFTTLSGLAFSARRAFTLSYLTNGVRLTVIAMPITVNSDADTADADPHDGFCDVDLATAGWQCTLRAAITTANALPGADTIAFALPANATTIAPASALPAISGPVTIDGSTQGSVCPQPGVTLDGQNAGADVDGLQFVAGSNGSSVRGLQIIRFDANGIHLDHSDNHTITCNQIGTDATGAQLGNGDNGIFVNWSRGNAIGGTAAADRNVIGRNNTGIALVGNNTAENVVRGNYIGLAGVDGSGAPIAANNVIGVALDTAQGNTIGGATAGAGNVISRNSNIGIYMTGVLEPGNVVQGNRIGTTPDGLQAAGNGSAFAGGAGILINASAANQIGGTAAGAGNLISANAVGLTLEGTYSTGNLVEGNRIGTDAGGAVALGNLTSGIVINDAPANTIGGTTAGAGNVISGNAAHGVVLVNLNATGNLLRGNRIGTTADGSARLANGGNGIQIDGPAGSNTIGGATAGAGNLISGNGGSGVYICDDFIFDEPSHNNVIAGNRIGTNLSGDAAIPNKTGITLCGATGTVIGGTAAGAGNLISGNTQAGLAINSGAAGRVADPPNSIHGNWIGLNAAGTGALPNRNGIVALGDGGLLIGGAAAGMRNVIGGNTQAGVVLTAAGAQLQGNYIGTDVSGMTAVPNTTGVELRGVAATIGDAAAGAGNVISGNRSHGVVLADTLGGAVRGNLIGLAADGATPLGNGGDGIFASSAAAWIGGSAAGAGNVIAGNAGFGVRILNNATPLPAFRPFVIGNGIGSALDGAPLAPNVFGGLLIASTPATVEENQIIGNGDNGVTLLGATRVALRRNAIAANVGLGIDINNDGVTANDAGDGDGGPNLRLNFPQVTALAHVGGHTQVELAYSGAPNVTVAVELFVTPRCDAAGHGEGGAFLDALTLTTDGSGTATGSISLPLLIAPDQFVTATATQLIAEESAFVTSEFGACRQIGAAPGAIAGSVSGADGVTLYHNISDNAAPHWVVVAVQTPAGDGSYSFSDLAPGSYALKFSDGSGAHATQFYAGAGAPEGATPVAVTAGNTTNLPPVTLVGGGTIAGVVSSAARAPLAAIQVVALRAEGGTFAAVGAATSDLNGAYSITQLPPGSYRLYFNDTAALYAPAYYGGALTIDGATAVELAAGQTADGRNATLNPLDALIDWSFDDPAVENPCVVMTQADGTILIHQATAGVGCEIIFTTPPGMVVCPAGSTVDVVLIGYSNSMGNHYTFASEIAPGVYSSGPMAVSSGVTQPPYTYTFTVTWACSSGEVIEVPFGAFMLYDPSGIITSAQNGLPIAGAQVTLYQVPGWSARTAPGQTTAETCESNLSKAPGAAWSQPAPVALGVPAAPLPTLIAPQQTTQTTTADGRYGWDVAAGCWYVVVSAPGYLTLVSPVVGVPTEVTDLDLALTPSVPTAVGLSAVAAAGGAAWLWLPALLLAALSLRALPPGAKDWTNLPWIGPILPGGARFNKRPASCRRSGAAVQSCRARNLAESVTMPVSPEFCYTEKMPEISRFFGIVIRMYYDDHLPPHFHAFYGDYEAQVTIQPIAMLGGTLPRRAWSLVIEWTALHQRELLANWDLLQSADRVQKIDPLE